MEYLFGINAASLEQARATVEEQLTITMEAREGLHHGGDYYHFAGEGYQFILQENVDLDDIENEKNGLAEPQFPQAQWLLYLDGLAALDLIAQPMADGLTFTLLRRRGGVKT